MTTKFICVFLALTSFANVDSYPFNNSECVECIEKFNYIHSHNTSINHMVNEFNSLCDYYNISGCRNLTNYGIELINQNSTIICEDLGYCDTLSMDSVAFDCNPYNMSIFRYYDLLIGYSIEVLDTNVLNFTKLWSTKITEPYTNISLVDLTTYYSKTTYNYLGCDVCHTRIWGGNIPNSIVKVLTENYIYYINITTGLVYDRLDVHGHRDVPVPLHIKLYQYPNSVLDKTYNGSLYNINIDVGTTPSKCNYTTPDNPNPTLTNCIYNSVNGISMNEVDINLPGVPPRCATALEMYCPHNIGGRENCLNCLVKKQTLLKTCSILQEENWCDTF